MRCESCGALRDEHPVSASDATIVRSVSRDGPGRVCDECRDWAAGRDGLERRTDAAWKRVGLTGLAKAREALYATEDK